MGEIPPQVMVGASDIRGMDRNVDRQYWIQRFASRLGKLGVALTPEELLAFAADQWKVSGHLSPEAVAEAEHAAGGFDLDESD
jgi:hypothetical protein